MFREEGEEPLICLKEEEALIKLANFLAKFKDLVIIIIATVNIIVIIFITIIISSYDSSSPPSSSYLPPCR